MAEVDVLQMIAKTLESTRLTMEAIRGLLFGISLALWLILLFKDCHGDNSLVAQAIKELTEHFRSRR